MRRAIRQEHQWGRNLATVLLALTALLGTAALASAEVPSSPQLLTAPQAGPNPQIGILETGSAGTWTGFPAPSFSFQWLRCSTDGLSCAPIDGANADSYAPMQADAGSSLRLQVTAANANGSAQATSATTAPVLESPISAGAPLVSGSPVVGQSLSTDGGRWIAFPAPQLSYSWLHCDALGGSCLPISGAADASGYMLTSAELGGTIRVQVTASNNAGSSAARSDASTTIVNPLPPVVTPPETGCGKDKKDKKEDGKRNGPNKPAPCKQDRH